MSDSTKKIPDSHHIIHRYLTDKQVWRNRNDIVDTHIYHYDRKAFNTISSIFHCKDTGMVDRGHYPVQRNVITKLPNPRPKSFMKSDKWDQCSSTTYFEKQLEKEIKDEGEKSYRGSQSIQSCTS